MALKSTIYKADLQVSDMDRNYYQEHSLTMARHPSETDERLMVRLLVFACYASEELVFSKGLSDVDEPDIWAKDLTDRIKLWIDLGQPDEKRILKACGRADQALVVCYHATSHIWWNQIKNKLTRAKNLQVLYLPAEFSAQLTRLAQRNMQVQCTIQDGQIWFSCGEESVQLEFERWM